MICQQQELIEYHSYNAGGLACRLKCPPGRSKPPTAGLSHGKWEIDPTELTLLEELGSGKGHSDYDVTKFVDTFRTPGAAPVTLFINDAYYDLPLQNP